MGCRTAYLSQTPAPWRLNIMVGVLSSLLVGGCTTNLSEEKLALDQLILRGDYLGCANYRTDSSTGRLMREECAEAAGNRQMAIQILADARTPRVHQK